MIVADEGPILDNQERMVDEFSIMNLEVVEPERSEVIGEKFVSDVHR